MIYTMSFSPKWCNSNLCVLLGFSRVGFRTVGRKWLMREMVKLTSFSPLIFSNDLQFTSLETRNCASLNIVQILPSLQMVLWWSSRNRCCGYISWNGPLIFGCQFPFTAICWYHWLLNGFHYTAMFILCVNCNLIFCDLVCCNSLWTFIRLSHEWDVYKPFLCGILNLFMTSI